MPSTIYRTTDRQASQLRYLMVAAVLNIALDAILIPRFGSVGAAVANGISQGFAVASMWGLAAQLGHLRMRWPIIARIAGAAVAMSLLVAVLCLLLHPPMALLVGTVVGVLSYIFFLRLFNAVRKSDVSAMSGLGERMQPRLRAIFAAILVSVISGDVADTEVPDEKLSTAQIDLCETPGSEDAKCEKPKAASLPCA
jgi:peptidoglycan biosynthesis protein MviN/MurJ (putative lipid II flippase)